VSRGEFYAPFVGGREIKDTLCSSQYTLYAKRDNRDWSGCVTTAGYLKTATTYINEDAKGQIAELCDATEEIYGYDEESFLEVEISPTDEDAIKDNLCDHEYFQILWIEVWREHIPAYKPWRGQHQEEACRHRLIIRVE